MKITKTRTRAKHGLLEYFQEGQPKTTSKLKSRLEKYEQKDLNFHCRYLYPASYDSMFHVVNESGRGGSAQYGAELNARGRKSGVPDWIMLVPKNSYHGLLIELKRDFIKDGKPTANEINFLKHHEQLGYKVVIAYGYKAALEAIKDYLINIES